MMKILTSNPIMVTSFLFWISKFFKSYIVLSDILETIVYEVRELKGCPLPSRWVELREDQITLCKPDVWKVKKP